MSDQNGPGTPDNPYTPPSSNAQENPGAGGTISLAAIDYLSKTAPWVRFISILAFIGSGLIILFGLIFMFSIGFVGQFMEEFQGVGAGVGIGMGLVYLIIGGVMLIPAVFLFRHSREMKNYLLSKDPMDLEQSFKNAKSFWKFYGILAIIYLSLLAVALLFGIIGAVIM